MQQVPTSGAEIENLISWLRKRITEVQYGQVGIVFTLHDGTANVERIDIPKTIIRNIPCRVTINFQKITENGSD